MFRIGGAREVQREKQQEAKAEEEQLQPEQPQQPCQTDKGGGDDPAGQFNTHWSVYMRVFSPVSFRIKVNPSFR